MSKKYFAWKDPNCNGINPEWIEMKGKEFAKFIKIPENKKRCFIRLINDVCMEADIILIETTKSEYVKWRKEYDHRTYLFEHSAEYEQVSLDYPYGDIDHHELHEIVADESANVENLALEMNMTISIQKAINKLSSDEFYIINQMYFCEHKKTERELCMELKIAKTTFHRRKEEILRKLKNIMDQN